MRFQFFVESYNIIGDFFSYSIITSIRKISNKLSLIIIIFIGSLIFNKYVQQNLQMQRQTGDINDASYRQLSCLCNQVHQVLYKYSETRLDELTDVPEFKQIIAKHAEIWRDFDVKPSYRQFYYKILSKFDIEL